MTERVNALVTSGIMTERQFFEAEIRNWKQSKTRLNQMSGERYYRGDHDILRRKRTVIGKDGILQEVENLPNSRIVDNQCAKMVDQKTNYLFGRPLTFDTEDSAYENELRKVFNKRFLRTLQNLGEDALNGGIGWLFLYYDEQGEFKFRRLNPFEVIPDRKDAEHTILDYAIRIFEVIVYNGKQE
jgi:SPP1 family phage portal protein